MNRLSLTALLALAIVAIFPVFGGVGGCSPEDAASDAGESDGGLTEGGVADTGATPDGGPNDGATDGDAPYNGPGLHLVAGGLGSPGHLDGVGAEARIATMDVIRDESTNTLFILEESTIRRIDAATGAVITIAGRYGSTTSIDGPKGIATLYGARAGAYDSAAKTLYFGDSNARVRRLDVTSGAIETVIDSSPAGLDLDPLALALDQTRHLLYVSGYTCQIKVVNTLTKLVVATWGTRFGCGLVDGPTDSMAISVPSNFAMTYDEASSTLLVLDNFFLRFFDTIGQTVRSVPVEPSGGIAPGYWIGFDRTTKRVFVPGSHAVHAVSAIAPPVRPLIRAAGPFAVAASATDTDITVSGYNFSPTSSVAIGSTLLATTYVSATTLTATIPGAMLTGSTTLVLDVFTPGAGGGHSASTFALEVGSPSQRPRLDVTDPRFVPAGSAAFTITLSGAGFQAGGQAYFGSTPLTTTVVNASTATASVPAGLLTQAAVQHIRFVNPSAVGGGGTTAFDFWVTVGHVVFAGSESSYGDADGPAASARFQQPAGLAFSPAENALYVADTWTIRKVAAGNVTTVAGRAPHEAVVDGIGQDARFDSPASVAYDPVKNTAYVVEPGVHTLRAVDLATSKVTTVAGYPNAVGSHDGAYLTSQFRYPMAAAFDPTKKLVYVADHDNFAIRAFDPATGMLSTFVGDPAAPGFVDGPKVLAKLVGPSSLTFDAPSHTLYFVDGFAIRSVDTNTTEVKTITGTKDGAYASVDGPKDSVRFAGPSGLAYDALRKLLYVADSGSSDNVTFSAAIRAVDVTTGDTSTLTGKLDVTGFVDGPKSTALFRAPHGLLLEQTGKNLLVTDMWTLRSVDLTTGAVTTRLGGVDRAGVRLGPFATASFRQIIGLTFAGSELLIVDQPENSLLRTQGF